MAGDPILTDRNTFPHLTTVRSGGFSGPKHKQDIDGQLSLNNIPYTS